MLIKGRRVLTMAGRDYAPGCVLIIGGKIVKVAQYIDPADNPDGVELRGELILPGLIDAHSHLGIFEEKKGVIGDSSNETTEPVTPYLKALDAINPMDSGFHNAIAAGITSVMVGPGSSNVVGGQFAFIKTRGRCIDDMVILEPAAMKIAFGENPKTNYGDNNFMPSSRMSIGAMLREELFKARQYCEGKKSGGDGFQESFQKECWLPVFEGRIPLKAHVHRADDILTAIRIAKLYGLSLTLDHCTEGHLIADKIREAGFPAIIGPGLASRNKTELQYMDFKTAGVLHRVGVTVAITTDHPVTLIQSLPLCAALAAKSGLGHDEALRAITINPARICRVDSRVGSLAPGKDGDVAVFDGDPLEVTTRCLYTVIDGSVAYDAARD